MRAEVDRDLAAFRRRWQRRQRPLIDSRHPVHALRRRRRAAMLYGLAEFIVGALVLFVLPILALVILAPQ